MLRSALAIFLSSMSFVSSAALTSTPHSSFNFVNRADIYASRIWQPPLLSRFQMILSRVPDIDQHHPQVTPNVKIYDIDLFDTPKEIIHLLHILGKKVICYFSAGTAEDWRPDYGNFTEKDMGAPLPLWPGERYLDLRSPNVWTVIRKRIRLASQKGCDAIDPDNMDGYLNENGGGLTKPLVEKDAIRFLRKMAVESRRYNMAIGLKNAPGILPYVTKYIQFAVNESCGLEEDDCLMYMNFTNPPRQGWWHLERPKPVFHIEYVNRTDNSSKPEITNVEFPNLNSEQLRLHFCLIDDKNWLHSTAAKLKFSTVIKDVDLSGWIMECDGSVAMTKTTYPAQGGSQLEAMNGTNITEIEYSEAELEKDLEGAVFPAHHGSVKDRLQGHRH